MKNETQTRNEANDEATSIEVENAIKKTKAQLLQLIQERESVMPTELDSGEPVLPCSPRSLVHLSPRTVTRLSNSEERYVESEEQSGRAAGQTWAEHCAEMFELRALERYIEAIGGDQAGLFPHSAAWLFWRIVRGGDVSDYADALDCWHELGIAPAGGPSVHFVEEFAAGAMDVLCAYDSGEFEEDE